MRKWLLFWRLERGSEEMKVFFRVMLWTSFVLALVFAGLYFGGVLKPSMPWPLLIVAFVCGLPFYGPLQYFIIRDPIEDPDDAPFRVLGWFVFAVIWPFIGAILAYMWLRRSDGSGGARLRARFMARSHEEPESDTKTQRNAGLKAALAD